MDGLGVYAWPDGKKYARRMTLSMVGGNGEGSSAGSLERFQQMQRQMRDKDDAVSPRSPDTFRPSNRTSRVCTQTSTRTSMRDMQDETDEDEEQDKDVVNDPGSATEKRLLAIPGNAECADCMTSDPVRPWRPSCSSSV